jgi:hypothetical protein
MAMAVGERKYYERMQRFKGGQSLLINILGRSRLIRMAGRTKESILMKLHLK